MKQVDRRTVLGFGVGAGALMLLGCGGAEHGAPDATAAPWVVNPPSFAVGGNGTFNLALTLPAGVTRGGSFGINPTGAKLPSGMTLTPAGILSVGSAAVGSVAGVVFTYSTP